MICGKGGVLEWKCMTCAVLVEVDDMCSVGVDVRGV